jgi:hypothetical protein
MSAIERDSRARLDQHQRDLDAVYSKMGELLPLPHLLDVQGRMRAKDLRAIGHTLVSLAGELTTLGVNMAHWADDLDQQDKPPLGDVSHDDR